MADKINAMEFIEIPELERRKAVRAEQRRSMSGFSAFTYWVRFKIPFALRQAQGERYFESLKCRF
jgi:hypothetical protein